MKIYILPKYISIPSRFLQRVRKRASSETPCISACNVRQLAMCVRTIQGLSTIVSPLAERKGVN